MWGVIKLSLEGTPVSAGSSFSHTPLCCATYDFWQVPLPRVCVPAYQGGWPQDTALQGGCLQVPHSTCLSVSCPELLRRQFPWQPQDGSSSCCLCSHRFRMEGGWARGCFSAGVQLFLVYREGVALARWGRGKREQPGRSLQVGLRASKSPLGQGWKQATWEEAGHLFQAVSVPLASGLCISVCLSEYG